MFEKRPFSSQLPKQGWCIDNPVENHTNVTRRFLNSAIYVEKPITQMPPLRKTSPLQISSDGANTHRSVKICSCSTSPETCRCHNNFHNYSLGMRETVNCTTFSSKSSEQSSNESDAETVKETKTSSNFNISDVKLPLSHSCSTVDGTNRTDREKQEIYRKWLAKKEEQEKNKRLKEIQMKEEKEKERQMILERERENFKKWLAEKKKDEERKRKEKERMEEEKKLLEAQKEKRQVETEITFNLWLRRKKKVDLERKIREKLNLIQVFEDKQRRIEENERAYDEWLKSSKNKPKPIPLNQGLQSLCSSASVAYINPVPWHPNIEPQIKPSSQ